MWRIAFIFVLVAASCSGTDNLTAESSATQTTPQPTPSVTTEAPAPTPETEVPDVEGLSVQKAEKALTRAALEVRLKKEYSHHPAGTVIGQDPSAGSQVPEGTAVVLLIARALPTIPNVVGLTVAQAERALRREGFEAKVKRSGTSGTPGTVTAQTPVAGSEARPGRTVTLVIPNCTEGYSPCLPPASDYDCIGGTGDGPKYTGRVTVTGSDPYGLDADNDGIGCET